MKQTAVEIVENKIEAEAIALFDGELTFNEFMDNISKYFNQAKEMEKEQIVTTWNTAHQAGRFEGKGIAEDNWQTFETYWEETFKSE